MTKILPGCTNFDREGKVLMRNICQECGQELPDGMNTCNLCGAVIVGSSPLPQQNSLHINAPVKHTTAAPYGTPPQAVPQQRLINMFTDSNPDIQLDTVSFSPKTIWYENGKLHTEMFVTNGFAAKSIYNIRDIYLEISNDLGIIARANFGILNGINISSHKTIVWTFVFSGKEIQIKDANLTGKIGTKYSSTYSY